MSITLSTPTATNHSRYATAGGRGVTIYSDINEDRDVVALARFFEEKTGWTVPIAHY